MAPSARRPAAARAVTSAWGPPTGAVAPTKAPVAPAPPVAGTTTAPTHGLGAVRPRTRSAAATASSIHSLGRRRAGATDVAGQDVRLSAGLPAPTAAAKMPAMAPGGSARPNTADPATNTLAPASATGTTVCVVDAPVHLDIERIPGGVGRPADLGDLGNHLGHERLAPETRKHRHAQHQIDQSEVGLDRLERGVRVGGQPDPEAQVAHLPDQGLGLADFDVDGAAVGPGVPERLEIAGRVGDHQVAVEEQVGVLAQRGHHRWADGQVGDEVAVHHVDVQPVGAGLDLADRLGQPPEVRRQDGGRHPHGGPRRRRGRAGRHRIEPTNDGLGDSRSSRSIGLSSRAARRPAGAPLAASPPPASAASLPAGHR